MWLEDGAFVQGPERGQRFVWFEYLTGTEGGSHHVFVLDFLTSLRVQKGKGWVEIKTVCGYMIF